MHAVSSMTTTTTTSLYCQQDPATLPPAGTYLTVDAIAERTLTTKEQEAISGMILLATTQALQVPKPDTKKIRHCIVCGTTQTPLWRLGPNGIKNYCNACGIRWKRANNRKAHQIIKPPTKKATAFPRRISTPRDDHRLASMFTSQSTRM